MLVVEVGLLCLRPPDYWVKGSSDNWALVFIACPAATTMYFDKVQHEDSSDASSKVAGHSILLFQYFQLRRTVRTISR